MARHDSDISAQKTFLGKDDKAVIAEQKRKRQQKQVLPGVRNGPCCARCQNWYPPAKDDDFGRCRDAVFITERVPGGPEKGTVMRRTEAARLYLAGWDYLPTRGFMEGCSMFKAKAAEEAA